MNGLLAGKHRFWISGLGLALLALIAAPLFGNFAQERLEQTRAEGTRKREGLSTQLRQWEEDARAARELSETLAGEDAETYLAPMSRALLAAQLEPLAASSRLSRLTYTLGPEEKWTGEAGFPNIKGLAQSHLSLEAEAALDADLFRFLQNLSALPGRMTLEHLSIKRIGDPQKPPSGLANLSLRAEITWLANAPSGREKP